MTIIRKTRPKPELVPEEPKQAREVSKPQKWNPTGEEIPVDALIRVPELCKLTGLSRATIYRRLKIGRFPKPCHPSPHVTAWVRGEIMRWLGYKAGQRQ